MRTGHELAQARGVFCRPLARLAGSAGFDDRPRAVPPAPIVRARARRAVGWTRTGAAARLAGSSGRNRTEDPKAPANGHTIVKRNLLRVRLTREDEDVPLPAWIGREVTTDERYRNSRLASLQAGKPLMIAA